MNNLQIELHKDDWETILAILEVKKSKLDKEDVAKVQRIITTIKQQIKKILGDKIA